MKINLNVRLLTPYISALCTCLLLAPTAQAQYSQPIEGFASGSLSGQGVWIGDTAPTVDTQNFSPLNGSTESVKFRGNGSVQSVNYVLPHPISSGVWDFSYDLSMTSRTTSNIVLLTSLRDSTVGTVGGNRLFGTYAQDGGAGIAQNGFFDPDGLGGQAFAGYGDIVTTGFRYNANQWYRLSYTIDLDQHSATNFTIYDISAGTLNPIALSPRVVYFNNDGTNYTGSFTTLALTLSNVTSAEGGNLDNFSLTSHSSSAAPEPITVGFLGLGLITLRLRKRK